MRQIILVIAVTATAFSATAAESPKALADRSLKFMNQGEALLMELVEDRDKQAYYDELWSPSVALRQSWPAIGNKKYDKFIYCQFALGAFTNFADATFKNGKRLRSSSLTLREYLKAKKRCELQIKGLPLPDIDE